MVRGGGKVEGPCHNVEPWIETEPISMAHLARLRGRRGDGSRFAKVQTMKAKMAALVVLASLEPTAASKLDAARASVPAAT